jgi:hypothetical protein
MSYYECDFCSKKYVSKGHFTRHDCEEMRRNKYLKTAKGIAAYETYTTWMKTKGYMNRGKQQFADSKYYTSIVKFMAFSHKMALPGRERFIEYMAELDIFPKDWSSNLVYDHYMAEFDTLLTPDEQASITVDTVFELGRIFECAPDDVFLHIDPNSLIKVVQAKKLSPWVLLFSSKFKWFMAHEMTREQRVLLQQYVNPHRWDSIFNVYPAEVDKMKTYVKALGI